MPSLHTSTGQLARLKAKEVLFVRSVEQYARQHLSGIKRRTGESYAEHGMEVAAVLHECVSDTSLIAVAILHDILVHPDGKVLLQNSPLKQGEQQLIEYMHSLRRLHIDSRTKDLDKVIDAFLQDERLLPLRMAHRLNDVRNIHRFQGRLKKQIARETLHMYSAIAGRLGMHAWRYEMEDICFHITQPKIARSVMEQFETMHVLDKMSLTHTHKFLEKILRKEKIPCEIEERVKGLFSTYRKMVLKKRAFQELTDRLAIRIVVPTTMDCYRTLALVHTHMHPIPGKLKDYIGSPKENGYQSIHSVVYPLPGVTEQPIEIQIRSRDMHELCEFGAASHAHYKSLHYALSARPARVNLFRNLENLREESRSPRQFEQALRKYFNEDHAAIFDGRNNLYHLRKPATALDFVVHAYPEQYPFAHAVYINGRRRQLDTPKQDGDIVDTRFRKTRQITKNWLSYCTHRHTKSGIVSALSMQ